MHARRVSILSLVVPAGALYAFPSVVGPAARHFDDYAFALELMNEEGVLVVPGSSFNVPYRDHFRVTLLPDAGLIREVFSRIDRALSRRAEVAEKVVPPRRVAPPLDMSARGSLWVGSMWFAK